MSNEESLKGVKNINIQVSGSYPVISAYEFEILKELPEVHHLWRESTIYLIVQRPLMYFNNLRINDQGVVNFEISDMRGNEPLTGTLDPYESGLAKEGESYSFSFHLYKGEVKENKSVDYAACFFIETESSEHLASITPQKVIHLSSLNSPGYKISGNLYDYIDYRVHYVGQAFSQDIWSRLTGHEKMQSILTREAAIDSLSNRNSLEISLILLEIVGFSEAQFLPFQPWQLSSNTTPILHDLGDDDDVESYMNFHKPLVEFSDQELTNEVEAMLINRFDPDYNKIKFKNYPNIKNGTRSKGYSESSLVLESNPTILESDKFKLNAIFRKGSI
ncbi:hypothetical protein CKO50_12610 [Pseudoalteromonas sp. HM-SA03]|uniref:hypothetical protein n=1 Tax=Pseudoalteromonas sp. HM-SA03 TaxID=2029678 RepID=UPI000BAE4173|nr:hypothetical protein [Pseudoalteromonas sp. HM-SA03]PAY00834.1 hypothetical protein CKO50_12610 [Pseudoalteromonas sp. HM-SA03]